MINQNISLVRFVSVSCHLEHLFCCFGIINIVLHLEFCTIFSEIPTSWKPFQFQCLLPGQSIVDEDPGMKCPSADVSEKVGFVFNKPRISFFISLGEEILVAPDKNSVHWSDFRNQVALGNVKNPCS